MHLYIVCVVVLRCGRRAHSVLVETTTSLAETQLSETSILVFLVDPACPSAKMSTDN